MRAVFKFALQPYGFWEACGAALLAAYYWCFGGLGLTLGVVLGFTVADFTTGIIRASMKAEVESSKCMRTVYKLVGYSLLLGLLHVFFVRYLPSLIGATEFTGSMTTLPHLVGAFIVLRELNSNIENLAHAGMLPKSVTRLLARVFRQVRESLESSEASKPGNGNGPPGGRAR